MSKPPEYTVMGEDGKDYGPVFDDQIRSWILEGRLGPKTPVRTARDKDWVFLAEVPAFAEYFQPKPAPAPRVGPRRGLVKAGIAIAILTALYYLVSYLLALKNP